MEIKKPIAHGIFFAAALPDWLGWQACRSHPKRTQEKRLRRILRQNADTEFGKRHGFAAIHTVQEYQQRVPLADYESFSLQVARMRAGKRNVLCREQPRLFQPTSGSTGAGKWIPYTPSLKREFLRGVNPWLSDLYLHRPRLFGGKAYWQISPAVDSPARSGSNVSGFTDDAEYLGPIAQLVWNEISAVPAAARHIADPNTFRYLSALCLLRAHDLRLISVWSPSFLSLLLETIVTHRADLLEDLRSGGISTERYLPEQLRSSKSFAFRPLPKRAIELKKLLEAPHICWTRVWPQLALISCWKDGFAKRLTPALERDFEGVEIQGKGVLATEGIVSFPLTAHPHGAVPAINSHFLEFCESASPQLRLVDELELGMRYSVVLTTGGGLYRYRLQDIVEVVGFADRLPLLRFIGRESSVSDLFGEKLHESQIEEAVKAALEMLPSLPQFTLFTCEKIADRYSYCLLLQTEVLCESTKAQLLETIETRLLDNIHYRYCRSLGQLGPLKLFYVREHGLATYVAALQKRGIREGDLKPGLLANGPGWLAQFTIDEQ